jgi:D-aminopeptidase
MRVLMLTDMEGISRITDYRECWPAFPEYWNTGRRKITGDVSAAAQGLLDGGATTVAVKNGHGTGGWPNLLVDSFPTHVQMFSESDRYEDFDASFQVGLHARCGTGDGFISHTNVPEFRIRVNDELITESHDDAWTLGLPLLGITGDETLERELDGSLSGVPFLGVQRSTSRVDTMPVHASEEASLDAIRRFAAACARNMRQRATPRPPENFTVEMSLRPDLADLVYTGSLLTRQSASVLSLKGNEWRRDAKPGLGAGIAAALRPWNEAHGDLNLSTEADMLQQSPESLERMRRYLDHWMHTNYPAWQD